MIISLCIVAYNEEKNLKKLFDCILKQDYPKNKTEVILIDNGSTDNTYSMMKDFSENEGFFGIKVIKITKNNLAVACNEAIKNMNGDIYVRVDAHAEIPADFLRQNVLCIQSGENVCGGSRPCTVTKGDKIQQMLLNAEQSLFGASFASYRREHNERKYLDSLFHIAIKKEVLKKVGGYNENLGRTEDNEMTYRLRKNGYKLCYEPNIKSVQLIRSSLFKMLKQKFSNGYWIGLTMGICPGCISLFHFAPLCLVLGFAATLLLCFFTKLPLLLLSGLYLLFDLFNCISVLISSKKFNAFNLLLPFVFVMLHLAYGFGTFIGLIKMPFWVTFSVKDKEKGVEL